MDYSGGGLDTASVLPLRLTYLGMSEALAGFDARNRAYPRFSIHLIVSGVMELQLHGENHVARPGDVVLFHKSSSFSYRNGGVRPLLRRYLSVEGPLLQPILHQTQLSECTIYSCVQVREFVSCVKEIRLALESTDPHRHQRISAHLYSILMLISAVRPPSDQPSVIRRFRRFIDDHIGEPIDRNRLAKASGISVSLMHDVFRKHLGMTPMQFVLEQRLLRARHLLSCSRLSVKEIAYQLGFEAPAHFSRRFKKSVGVSPKDFREGCTDSRPTD